MNPTTHIFSNSVRLRLQKIMLFVCLFLIGAFASAQTKDTLAFYKKIQKIAYKHKSTTLLYKAIFVEPVPKQYEKKDLSDKQKKTDPNLKYEGKIIRNIDILVYDPFGYSVNDVIKKE